jgi:deoxyribose-phosphate aldolase
MKADELARLIDLSLLRPEVTERDLEELIRRALLYPFASVCIPPSYVGLARKLLKGSPIKVGTVVGFPLGYQTPEVKLIEALEAVGAGAQEIDLVMNISRFKSGELKLVEEEIKKIATAFTDTVLKVIIETCYLTDQEKVLSCGLAIRGGADFVKTSTGFGPAGASEKDVRLLRKATGGKIKVKASGGINTLDGALRMVRAGAERIGTSSGIEILKELSRS